jgi:hypothetical protein
MGDSKQGGGEPSMEEILASIRKIISEDTADDGHKQAETSDTDDTAAAGADRSGSGASADGTANVGEDVLELSDGDSDDDAPLDLTEEVDTPAADTGAAEETPLELDEPVEPDAETSARAEESGDSAADAPAGDAPAGDDIGAYDDWPTGDWPTGDESTETGEPDGPEADAAEADADDTPVLADPFDDTAAGAPAPDTAAEAALAAGAMAGAGGAAADGSQDGRRSEDTASPLGPEDQRVISENAEQQAVDQLTSLARQAENAPGDTAADNVDHILARMVRDALRPQLREWMDRNLPQIVERIVREEVQRMIRRAQGLDDDTRY